MDRPSEPGHRAAPSNPLLSSAVTGLCLQDLTHHAVLLPARAPDSLNSRPQNTTLRNTGSSTIPQAGGDGNGNKISLSNVNLAQTTSSIPKPEIGTKNSTESKASVKSHDDFDVNEYFARLQGTRYVSAPLNSVIKEDKNANLQESEENLEEINLLEDSRSNSSPSVQQSLTADIAQNFSQLPQVFPQVASAVFSSFSSILNLNKSREQTPAPDNQYGQSYVDFGQGHGSQPPETYPQAGQVSQKLEGYVQTSEAVPMFTPGNLTGVRKLSGAEERSDVVSPQKPPVFDGPPPVRGAGNAFRMAAKKKTYAHIPGLSTGETPTAPQMNPFYANFPTRLPSDQAPEPYTDLNLDLINPVILHSTINPSDLVKDTNQGPSSSAVMTEISESLLPTVVAKAKGFDVDVNTPGSQVSSADVTDFSGATMAQKTQTGLGEKPTVKDAKYVNLFSPQETITDRQGISLSVMEGFASPGQHFATSANWSQTDISATGNVPRPSNLDGVPLQSSMPSAVPPQSNVPFSVPLTTNYPVTTPPASHMPSAAPLTSNTLSDLPITIGLPLMGNASTFVSSSVSNFAQNLLSNLPPASPQTGTLLPPTGALPPAGSLPPRQASLKRPLLPPSVARKAPNTQSPLRKDSLETEPNMFASSPPHNLSTSDASVPMFSNASVPHIFTPAFTEPSKVELSPSDNLLNTPPIAATMPSQLYVFGSSSPSESENIAKTETNVGNPLQTFFNPVAFGGHGTDSINAPNQNVSSTVTQPPMETPKPPVEPPKMAPGGQSFRLGTKKRPQYYSGPIVGTAPIGNTVKPTLEPVFPSSRSELGNVSLFTPTLEPATPNAQTEIPQNFVQNQGIEFQANVVNAVNDIGQQPGQYTDTAFDLSRPAQDIYNSAAIGYNTSGFDVGAQSYQDVTQRDDSKGDLLGTLKSKFNAVNINKLQSAVTSFFDPAYYETEKKENVYDNSSTNFSYGQTNTQNVGYGQEAFNLEISVPTVDSNTQYQLQTPQIFATPYNYPTYAGSNTGQYVDNQNHGNYYSSTYESYGQSNMAYPPTLYENYRPEHHPDQMHNADRYSDSITEYGQNVAAPIQGESFCNTQIGASECEVSNTEKHEIIAPLVITTESTELTLNDYIPNITEDNNDNESTMNIFSTSEQMEDKEAINETPSEESVAQANKETEQKNNMLKYFGQQNPIDFFGASESFSLSIVPTTESNFTTEPTVNQNQEVESEIQANKDECNSSYSDNKNSDDNTYAITTQMIENITSPMQLFNPVEAPLTESNNEVSNYSINENNDQFNEISQITEETIETIQIQSSNEFFDKEDEGHNTIKNNESNMFFDEAYGNYGWSMNRENDALEVQNSLDHASMFQDNVKKIGFKDDPLNNPKNASDEIKAELQHVTQDDLCPPVKTHNFLPRQMSTPSAPPAEDVIDTEKQESMDVRTGVLDVNLIEQDAKRDSPEWRDPIEPAETDDDKLEKEKSEEPDFSNETKGVLEVSSEFENVRLISSEGANVPSSDIQMIDQHNVSLAYSVCENVQQVISPVVSFASYFDTGNYAADNYLKNAQLIQNTTAPVMEQNELSNIQESLTFKAKCDDTFRDLENKDPQIDSYEYDIIDFDDSDIEESIANNSNAITSTDDGEGTCLSEKVILEAKSMFHSQASSQPTSTAQEEQFQSSVNTYTENNTRIIPDGSNPRLFLQSNFKPYVPQNMKENGAEVGQTEQKRFRPSFEERIGVFAKLHEQAKATSSSFFPDPDVNKGNEHTFKDHNQFFGPTKISQSPFRPYLPQNVKEKYAAEEALTQAEHQSFQERTEVFSKLHEQAKVTPSFVSAPEVNNAFKDHSQFFDTTNLSQSPFKQYLPQNVADEESMQAEEKSRSQSFQEGTEVFVKLHEQTKATSSLFIPVPGVNKGHEQPLKDHLQFFVSTSNFQSSSKDGGKPPSFNLLASYFDTPPETEKTHKPDPKRSFFELSEGQDHYMHPKQDQGAEITFLAQTTPQIFGNDSLKEQSQLNWGQNVCAKKNIESEIYGPVINTENGNDNNVHRSNKICANLTETRSEFNSLNDNQLKLGSNNIYSNISHFVNVNVHNSEYLPNMPHVQSNRFNEEFTNYPYVNNLSNDNNLNNTKPCAKTSEADSNTAEYECQNLKTVNDNYDFISELNDGGEIEESFTDYETRLAAIINNCDYCRTVKDHKELDVESELGVIDIDKEVHVESDKTIIDGIGSGDSVSSKYLGERKYTEEAMDSDGKQKGKGGEVNLKPSAGASGRGARASVTFEDLQEEENYEDESSLNTDNAEAGQYRAVRHHWFFRQDRDDKSVWRPFSACDSNALEDAHSSPKLTDGTVVATDGGRYDVRVLQRTRSPVYWTDKPTNVRRCSWFYKGTSDSRYVPYTEAIADLLEEEFRRGCESGEWHRRVPLPGGENVVLHGPSVMVHFLQDVSPDSWGNTPQSVMRPRVVRRGVDEAEIEAGEPSVVDHLLLLCHGIGSACDLRFRPVEEVVDDFRATSLQLIQSHYRKSYEKGEVGRVEVLPVSWHSTLHSGKSGVDVRVAAITLDSIPRLRGFCNDTVLDVLFYTSPLYCQTIMDTVCAEMNRIYELFSARNPGFAGGVSLGGHSLGSVILFDLLCHQRPAAGTDAAESMRNVKQTVGAAGTGQPFILYPQLLFHPRALYALGSPIAIFECIRGVDSLGEEFALPTCPNFFNIFHPYDPVAYRIEPLINPELKELRPLLIPHHKGRKRMHLELKETMARVGADIRQRLVESLRSTWASVWRAPQPPPPPPHQLQKVIQEQLEQEAESAELDSGSSASPEPEAAAEGRLGRLNGGRRVDHVLQEAPFEIFNEYLFALTSHVCYWESEDTMLLMLREIYNARGVAADSTLPQQTMTLEVQRAPSTERQSSQEASRDRPSTSGAPL